MARVLLLGTDKERAAGIRSLLRQDGHLVSWLRAVDDWRAQERVTRPEIIVCTMGCTERVLAHRGGATHGFPAPLLLLQQETEFQRDVHVPERLVDRIGSPFMGDEFLGRVDALLRVGRLLRHGGSTEPGRRSQGGLASRLGGWLRSRFPGREHPRAPYLEVAARVAEWADRRDAFEPGHAERVTSFAAMMADGLGLDQERTEALLRAAMLHDIGKVALPVEVLHQKQPLEEGQRRLIRTHPARGAALLRVLDPDEEVARAILYHHERPDGAGYYGKEAAGVPQAAQVLAVAEAYDAMTSCRLRPRLSPAAALDCLKQGKGTAFDAECVDALVDQLHPKTRSLPLSPV
jgi:putative nucleotidyltransferase with HDIG domain